MFVFVVLSNCKISHNLLNLKCFKQKCLNLLVKYFYGNHSIFYQWYQCEAYFRLRRSEPWTCCRYWSSCSPPRSSFSCFRSLLVAAGVFWWAAWPWWPLCPHCRKTFFVCSSWNKISVMNTINCGQWILVLFIKKINLWNL